jgi:HK97 family phage major capsid protein
MSDYANMLAALTPNVDEDKTFWACSPTAAAQVYQLVAGNQLYLGNFQQSPQASPTAQRNLGGVALHKTDMLPALDTVGDILLINGDGYIIGDRQSMSIAYSEGPRFTNNEMTWRFVHRVGGRTWYNKPITLPDTTTTVSHFVALSHA